MRRMIADKAFPYRSTSLKVGDKFDADDQDIHVLTVIGHAHVAPDQEYDATVMTAGREYDTKVMIPRRGRGRPKKIRT